MHQCMPPTKRTCISRTHGKSPENASAKTQDGYDLDAPPSTLTERRHLGCIEPCGVHFARTVIWRGFSEGTKLRRDFVIPLSPVYPTWKLPMTGVRYGRQETMPRCAQISRKKASIVHKDFYGGQVTLNSQCLCLSWRGLFHPHIVGALHYISLCLS